MNAPAELGKEVTMGWNFPWGFSPSHLTWLTTSDVLVIIAIIVVLSISFTWFIIAMSSRDKYLDGFHDGLHSGLVSKAKQRYVADIECVESLIPEEEYNKVLDQYVSNYYTPKWMQKIKNKFNKKEGKECIDVS